MKFIFKNLPKTKIALLAILVFSLLLISISSAATSFAAELNIKNPFGETSDIYTLIKKIIDFLFGIAVLLTPIIIIYAGFLYITSAGNADKIKTAQKVIIWALVGFAIVLIANSIPTIIKEFLYGKEEAPAEAPEAPAESAEPDDGGGAGVIPDESGGGGGAGVIPDESGGGGGAGVIPTSGTYKTCRKPASGSWAWLTGNANTLYCKEATWTGENPGDKCSVLDEVCL